MANPCGQEVESIVSDVTPPYYTVSIQSFPALAKNSIEKYESSVFRAGGYEWKLIIYPNGNKSNDVNEHISMYLAIVDKGSFAPRWEVHAVFRFFLLDQRKGKYVAVQDGKAKERCFHGKMLEWGIDELLPLSVFNDARNGYLVNDTCEFGAEVFVSKERRIPKGENLLMTKDPWRGSTSWWFENFSKLDKEFYDTTPFKAGKYKWCIRSYPKGKDFGSNKYMSLYLVLAETESLSPGTKIGASFTLTIFDRANWAAHLTSQDTHWFSASSKTSAGWWAFMSVPVFTSSYLVNDVCSIYAEVRVLGVVNSFP